MVRRMAGCIDSSQANSTGRNFLSVYQVYSMGECGTGIGRYRRVNQAAQAQSARVMVGVAVSNQD
jgi:hypothetical protein